MSKAIIIPADAAKAPFTREIESLEGYQAAVGGDIQAAPVDRDDVALYINEEGKIHRLPRNERADRLWVELLPSGRILGDYLAGDVVLVGSDDDGDDTDVPEEFLRRFGLAGSDGGPRVFTVSIAQEYEADTIEDAATMFADFLRQIDLDTMSFLVHEQGRDGAWHVEPDGTVMFTTD